MSDGVVNSLRTTVNLGPSSSVTKVGSKVTLSKLPGLEGDEDRAKLPGLEGDEDRVPKVSKRAFSRLPAFRLNSSTGTSIIQRRVSEDQRQALTPLLEELADHLADQGFTMRTVRPTLDEIVVIDNDSGESKTLHPSDLEPEALAVYKDLKTVFNVNHGGPLSTRPAFNGHEKSNKNGATPFQSRVSANPSSDTFMQSRFDAITSNMTESQKLTVEARVKLAEVYVVKKIAAYERIIEKTVIELQRAEGDDAKKLEKDLKKLKADLAQLKKLDAHALYWLAAFYPENPQDKQECIRQSKAIEKAALEITDNAAYAKDLAAVFIPERSQYFNFCSRNGIEMKNTQPMEDQLRSIVAMEKDGVSEEIDEDVVTKGYQSDFVKSKLIKMENQLRAKANEEIDSIDTKRAEVEGRNNLASIFVKNRAEGYRALVKHLSKQPRAADAAAAHKMDLNIDRLKVHAYELEEIGLTDSEKQNKAYLERRLQNAQREGQTTKALEKELAKLDKRRLERFAKIFPYFVDNPQQQRERLPLLKEALRKEGLSDAEVQHLENLLLNSDARKIFREMRGLEKTTDSDAFANGIVEKFRIPAGSGTNDEGEPLELANFTPDVENKIKLLEKKLCDVAKESLNPAEEEDEEIEEIDEEDEFQTEEDFARLREEIERIQNINANDARIHQFNTNNSIIDDDALEDDFADMDMDDLFFSMGRMEQDQKKTSNIASNIIYLDSDDEEDEFENRSNSLYPDAVNFAQFNSNFDENYTPQGFGLAGFDFTNDQSAFNYDEFSKK